jgi:hypothetical protein
MKQAAFVCLALVLVLAASVASADPRGGGRGWGGHHRGGWSQGWRGNDRPRYYPRNNAGEAFWGGVVGGAIGSIFAPPPVVISPPPVVVQEGPRSIEWCMATFRSYDPETGYYTAYDGRRLPCP